MVRRGWSPARRLALASVALLAAGAACSDDGDGEEPAPTTDTTPASLPDDVEAGTGMLLLDGERTVLTVRTCALEPVTDAATGVVTDLAVDADDGISLAVSITRSTTPGAVPTVTDVVTLAEQSDPASPDVLEAERAETGGRYLDLLTEGAITPLLSVDGELITAEGTFGPLGARPGAEGVVEGSLIVRCPPAG
jgi:hypothetical protein